MQAIPSNDAIKSDTPNSNFSWISCSGAGTIVYGVKGGGTRTITAPNVGFWYPAVSGLNVRVESTATGIVVA